LLLDQPVAVGLELLARPFDRELALRVRHGLAEEVEQLEADRDPGLLDDELVSLAGGHRELGRLAIGDRDDVAGREGGRVAGFLLEGGVVGVVPDGRRIPEPEFGGEAGDVLALADHVADAHARGRSSACLLSAFLSTSRKSMVAAPLPTIPSTR